MHIGRGGRHRVDQLGPRVHANVSFHPEVPLVALPRLTHLGIALLFPVLGRTGRVDQGRIHDGPSADSQSSALQVFPHLLENGFSQPVGLQQVAELADRRLIRRWLPSQVDPHKTAHRLGIVERFLHRWDLVDVLGRQRGA